jgi:hypothetical protein
MSTNEMIEHIADASPRLKSKVVGLYYLLTLVMGTFVLFVHGRFAFAADLLATAFYIAATAFVYVLSRPVNGKHER